MPGSPRWIALLLLLLMPPLVGCEDGSPLLATAVEDVAPGPRAPVDLGVVDGQPDAMPDVAADAMLDAMADASPDAMPDAMPDQGITPLIPYDPVCENLSETHCGYPWPTDRWLIADGDTATGYRLNYDGRAMPANVVGQTIDATPYARFDGFSPGSQLLALFPRPADLDGIGGPDAIDASLADDFPTVVIDLETGARVPHWIENDARADGPDATALYIRPADRLAPDRRYGVAIRGLRDADGAPLPTPAGFAALRDDTPSGVPAFEARRPGFEALFTALEAAGVPRGDLQLAWWFHTESLASVQGPLLAMRDDADARLGARGLGCSVVSVDEDAGPELLRVVTGTVTTPWYLDRGTQPARVVTDADGRPRWVEDREVSFTALVPRVAADGPARLVLFGHGLFGDADGTLRNPRIREAANALGAVIAGTDWAGMSSSDLGFLATALTDVSRFWYLGEMLQQGIINHIALARTMAGLCLDDPAFRVDDRGAYDPVDPMFYGISQGSILGGALMAVHPDIRRSVLAVGGSDFSFMIERSIHFDSQFQRLLGPSYPRRVDTALLMALSQHVWDRAESGPWMARLGDPAEGRQVLYLIAENDAQVPNLSSARAARAAGFPALANSSVIPWGMATVEPPYAGSAWLAMDIGDRPTPAGNLSPLVDDGGHSGVSSTPAAQEAIGRFLETGVVDPPCPEICRFGD